MSTIIMGLKKQKELNYVGLSPQVRFQMRLPPFDSRPVEDSHNVNLADQLVKIITPKKPALCLNMRNTKLSRFSAEYLEKALK